MLPQPTTPSSTTSLSSLPPPLLHAKNLHHTDKDIQKVQLQTDTLIDDILADHPPLGHAGMHQDLLNIVEGETAKDGEAAIEPDLLAPHQGAGGGGWQHQGREAGDGHDGDTRQQRAAQVQVFFLLGRRAHKRDGAHHPERVEPRTREDGG
jgi:hypothetical protein